MSDVQDALDFYGFLSNTEPDGTEQMTICVIPGPPPSKSRVRFGRGNAYSRPEAVAAERRTAVFVQRSLRGYKYPGNVALGCIFYRPTYQRVDADNMLKHVCDAINGIAFADDSQVTAIAARVELDKDNPRTVLVLGPHQSSLARGVNGLHLCLHCSKPITGRRNDRDAVRYCSLDCKRAARDVDLSAPVPCAHCGKPFVRASSYRTLCSPECRSASLRDKRKSKGRALSNCSSCGKQLSHNRGGRCRGCWRAAPKAGAA